MTVFRATCYRFTDAPPSVTGTSFTGPTRHLQSVEVGTSGAYVRTVFTEADDWLRVLQEDAGADAVVAFDLADGPPPQRSGARYAVARSPEDWLVILGGVWSGQRLVRDSVALTDASG